MTRAIATVVLAAALTQGCTNAAVSKAVGTGGDGGEAIVVRATTSAVVIENHSGRPLLNVRVTLTPADSSSPFIAVAPSIDTGATTELALTGFKTSDDVIFDPAVVRPTEIHVTARDTVAKSYDVTVPWNPGSAN
jgi:hypothetical protein